jgi:hypothetical protein
LLEKQLRILGYFAPVTFGFGDLGKRNEPVHLRKLS